MKGLRSHESIRPLQQGWIEDEQLLSDQRAEESLRLGTDQRRAFAAANSWTDRYQRIDSALRGAAKVYITDLLDVYENGVELPKPTVTHVLVSLPSDQSFRSYEQARAYYYSPEYQAARQHRLGAADGEFVLVEGV